MARDKEPQLKPVPVKAVGSARYAAGTWAHRSAFDRVARSFGKRVEHPSHHGGVFANVETTALLVPEPTNEHDSNAVQVCITGELVGYLPREMAADYARVLGPLAARGEAASCRAVLKWSHGSQVEPDSRDVALYFPAPYLMFPANEMPAGPCILLPDGMTVKADPLEAAQQIGERYLESGEAWVYGTLHEAGVATARTNRPSVALEVDGKRVAVFKPKAAEGLLPVVRRAESLGVRLGASVFLKGNALGFTVSAAIQNAADLPKDWLSALESQGHPIASARHPEASHAPAAVIFERAEPKAPPEAPPPPALPPPNWYPDPLDAAMWRYWDGAAWTKHRAPR